jgi:hypothetical protein
VTLLTPDLPHMRTAIEYEDGSTEVDPFGCLEKAMATYALGGLLTLVISWAATLQTFSFR